MRGTDLLNQWTRLYTQSREDDIDAMAALQKVAQHILDSAADTDMAIALVHSNGTVDTGNFM